MRIEASERQAQSTVVGGWSRDAGGYQSENLNKSSGNGLSGWPTFETPGPLSLDCDFRSQEKFASPAQNAALDNKLLLLWGLSWDQGKGAWWSRVATVHRLPLVGPEEWLKTRNGKSALDGYQPSHRRRGEKRAEDHLCWIGQITSLLDEVFSHVPSAGRKPGGRLKAWPHNGRRLRETGFYWPVVGT